MSEKLCLKWNDFQDTTSSAFGSLRNDRDFADVTLACEDGHQVEAHKVILASSSPFFQNLLRKNKHPHPLIYMRGVKSEDLVAIVDFLYFGEANVYQESLDAFLAIAEELQLKGLTGNTNDEHVVEIVSKPTKMPVYKRRDDKTMKNEDIKLPQSSNEYGFKTKTESIQGAVALTTYAVDSVGDVIDIQTLDEKVRSLMQKSQNLAKRGDRRADMCTVCGKEGESSSIISHIEANHLEGVSIPCNNCGKIFRYRYGLGKHYAKWQKGYKRDFNTICIQDTKALISHVCITL